MQQDSPDKPREASTLKRNIQKCTICGIGIKNMESHILSSLHSISSCGWFNCPYCPLKFYRPGSYRSHKSRKHKKNVDEF